MSLEAEDSFELTRRITPIMLFFFLFVVLVIGRIMYLQIGMGEELKKQSQVNRIRHDVLPAQRGAILDRNGKVLAVDEPVFNLVRKSEGNDISDTTLTRLTKGLNLDFEDVQELIHEENARTIAKSLTDSQRIWFAEQSSDFPQFDIQVRPRRVYRFGSTTAPVLGYTGEISDEELDRRREEGLSQGKYVGKTGVEKYYDSTLQGQDGLRWIETTATGERIRVLDSPQPIRPQAGDSLPLNLDIFLQEAVARSFPSDSSGAAVVMELPEGQIRALYSHPSYDPNEIVSGVRKRVGNLLQAPGDPLHNRVVQSRFPPGSTFKPIPYLAALVDSSFSPQQTYRCTGEYDLGDQTFKCWEEDGHGDMSLDPGLIHSCNVYFYNLIRDLGYQPVKSLAQQLGFEEKTGIDLPDEVSPQLSTPELKQELTGRKWVGGDALNAVIGQGFTLVSPIKQAQLFGTLVTGDLIRPAVRKNAEAVVENDYTPIKKDTRERLIGTLDDIADDGTGYWAQHNENYESIGIDVIGKTGTVQKVKKDDDEDTPPSDAWFLSAAPREDPKFVVVVFREEAGSGGSVAAPHVREIYSEMIALGYFPSHTTES